MESRAVVGLVESIHLLKGGKKHGVKARIDTGATKSSMDINLADKFKLGPVIRQKQVKSAQGISMRPVIKAKIIIKGKQIEGEFTLAERAHMTYPMLIGQNILKKGKFMVDPLQ